MKALFILHGGKRQSARLAEEIRRSAGARITADCLFTRRRGDGEWLCRNHATGYDVVVACGGDGTIHECVNGLMALQRDSPEVKLPALSLWPIGSGNDFARNFSIPTSPEEFLKTLSAATPRHVDVGKITTRSGDQWFINEASCGLTTEVVRRVNRSAKPLGATIAFLSASIRAMLRYKKQRVEVRGEGFVWEGKAMAVVAANGRWFGSGLCIAPEALVDDGLLDITVVGDIAVLDYLRYLPTLRRGEKIDHPEVHYYRSPWVEIDGLGSCELDGEEGPELPVRVEVMKGAISVMGMT